MEFLFSLRVSKGQAFSVNSQLCSVPGLKGASYVPKTIGKSASFYPEKLPLCHRSHTYGSTMAKEKPNRNRFFACVAKLVPEKEKEAWFAV